MDDDSPARVAGLLPNATIKIYPDAAHGLLIQYHDEFAADVIAFLGSPPADTQTLAR